MLIISQFAHEVLSMIVLAPFLAIGLRIAHIMISDSAKEHGIWREAVIEEFGEYYSRAQVEAMRSSAELRGDIYSVRRCNSLLNG